MGVGKWHNREKTQDGEMRADLTGNKGSCGRGHDQLQSGGNEKKHARGGKTRWKFQWHAKVAGRKMEADAPQPRPGGRGGHGTHGEVGEGTEKQKGDRKGPANQKRENKTTLVNVRKERCEGGRALKNSENRSFFAEQTFF